VAPELADAPQAWIDMLRARAPHLLLPGAFGSAHSASLPAIPASDGSVPREWPGPRVSSGRTAAGVESSPPTRVSAAMTTGGGVRQPVTRPANASAGLGHRERARPEHRPLPREGERPKERVRSETAPDAGPPAIASTPERRQQIAMPVTLDATPADTTRQRRDPADRRLQAPVRSKTRAADHAAPPPGTGHDLVSAATIRPPAWREWPERRPIREERTVRVDDEGSLAAPTVDDVVAREHAVELVSRTGVRPAAFRSTAPPKTRLADVDPWSHPDHDVVPHDRWASLPSAPEDEADASVVIERRERVRRLDAEQAGR